MLGNVVYYLLSFLQSSKLFKSIIFIKIFRLSYFFMWLSKRFLSATHLELAFLQVEIFIRKMNSIPAFTANLTVESFNRRTLS